MCVCRIFNRVLCVVLVFLIIPLLYISDVFFNMLDCLVRRFLKCFHNKKLMFWIASNIALIGVRLPHSPNVMVPS